MKKSVLNTSLRMVLGTVFAVTLGISVSACSDDKEVAPHGQVMAVDRVDAAADLARKNAPKAEEMVFEQAAPAAATDETATAAATPDSADAAPAETAAAVPVAATDNAGEQLYNAQCMACHATGLLNAPKYGDAAAWKPRIAQGKDTLYTHAAKGFNQMPAQATNGVTEEQIHAAVDYMVAAAS
ncbi:c-type cytochrome [Psychrobacter sp. 16-MNA-CIBAN-0192]|uniref:c-type cytochrome n=1 Tax=Psychrobacter sp. 16-MNA-CIBAN-0192 TaxID=3140448 RepID=UPI0033262F0A